MTCLQHLRHSLACTAWQRLSARRVRAKTEKGKRVPWRAERVQHVPLWYFTREGLCEAAHTVRQSDDNDTLAVTKSEEGQVSVQSAGSLMASKNVKLDHHLPYAEFMYTKNLFLMAIDNAKWGEETVDSFNWFFHNLDNHSI